MRRSSWFLQIHVLGYSRNMQHIPKSNIKTNAQSGSSQYDFLDDSLKGTLADQIHHLGGIETCDWSILIATFDNFYRATDNSTRKKLYNKFVYWQRYPKRLHHFICLANSPALKSSREANFPSTPTSTPTPQTRTPSPRVPMMSDYLLRSPDSGTPNASLYTQYLPTGYDVNRIGTFCFVLYTAVIHLLTRFHFCRHCSSQNSTTLTLKILEMGFV